MKKTFYFSHDYNARNDPKIQELMVAHGVAGVGVYWCIIEMLYEQDGKLPMKQCNCIAFALHLECKIVQSVINDFSLFQNDGNFFWSESVLKRINHKKKLSNVRKESALTRWQSDNTEQEQSKCNANAFQMQCKNRNKIKENNIKENPIIDRVKEKTASRFLPPTLEEVKAYILEKGYMMNAERFIAFYESKGWFVGKNKMKNWRAAAAGWEKRDQEERKKHQQPVAQQRGVNKSANDEW